MEWISYTESLVDLLPAARGNLYSHSGVYCKSIQAIRKILQSSNNHDVMSSDVLEHVRLYIEALKEIYWVTKPEVYFLLQVPYVHEWPETRVKVHPFGENNVFLNPPEYHAENTLVYRIYG